MRRGAASAWSSRRRQHKRTARRLSARWNKEGRAAADSDASSHDGVLFDLDGTLVDTNYLHTLAWSRALRDAGEWAPTHKIHRLVGMGGEQLVQELLGHDCPKAIEARPRRYKELQGDSAPFPGAAELLRLLKKEGLTVVIATSAPRDELDAQLDLLDANDAISEVTSADDVEHAKPEPDVFSVALERSGLDRRRCLVVGDSVWDVRASRAAGLGGCIALESGGFSRHELSEAGAIAIYRDVQELLDQFSASPLHP